MRFLLSKWGIIAAIVLVVLGVGAAALIGSYKKAPPVVEPQRRIPTTETIGASVQGRTLKAYTYGDGEKHLVFVGGVHGGYEWNSVLLAYQFMDYLGQPQNAIPADVRVTVIPSANPDGVYAVVGVEGRFTAADVPTGEAATVVGRFNARGVDLNRNFDCKWKPESMWRGSTVNGGSAAFSEPESRAIRDFVLKNDPDAVIFWHSQSNAVYASECEAGILPSTLNIMHAYSRAAGYKAVEAFDAYEITGDAEGWLASIGIPAITVELQTHETIEWERNLAGIKAMFELYSE